MIPLSEVRVLDRNAEALGVPVSRLVEAAARAVADAASSARGAILVLAGPGNNGADGLAAARLLHEAGRPVAVMTPVAEGGFRSEAAREAVEALPDDVDVAYAPSIEKVAAACARSGLVIDALLGAGVAGELREPYASWARVLAEHAEKVLAVDVPTGFAYVPDATVTFHELKEGMDASTAGRITVADIGIPREASLYTGPGEYLLYPQGKWDQHKGEGGIVLVIGGGPYTGAPAISGLAALRAGADLAIVLTPKRAWSVVAGYSPNLVVRPLERDEVDFDDPANRVTLNTWMKKAKAVVVGPGLGLFDTTQRAVQHVVERCRKEAVPCVVDADALAALAERKDLLHDRVVLTPHAREFRTLSGVDLPKDPAERAEVARKVATDHAATWLVKGPVDVVTDGRRLKLNATGHPAMSVAGTGDALAGVVGCLLSKGLAPFDAARLAARMLGEAGEHAAATRTWGLLATDVVDALPSVLARGLPKRPVVKRDRE